jgi:hypothetical protein
MLYVEWVDGWMRLVGKVVLVCFVVWVESLRGGVLVGSSIEWQDGIAIGRRTGLTKLWLFVVMRL